MKSVFLLCLGIVTMGMCQAQIIVSPEHEHILYTGRFSFADPEEPSFSMNGASIQVNFDGTEIKGHFSVRGGNSFLYVIIDGQADPYNRQVLEISGISEASYVIATGLPPGLHTLELIKLNESGSTINFYGLEIQGAGLTTKPQRPAIQLEFIGDSNTAGWAAWDAYDNGSSKTSGAYFTFPGITSRLLNAEYSLVGGSGSGIQDRTSWNLTKHYGRIHLRDPQTPQNTWNFADNYWEFQPEAVVVNLGANDYYAGTSKLEIKEGWKSFIQHQLRVHYPEAHIVLANSYGWAYNEPADYVHEAIEELHRDGERNVSYLRFPWLWGQSHAVINEHAGFANLLASHLARELNLGEIALSELSSFVSAGEIYNGSFEKSILPGIADGWRPHGGFELVLDESEALDGRKCVLLKEGGWLNFATEVNTGDSLLLSAWAKAAEDSHSGLIKIEFKDQAQKTIQTQQLQPDFNTAWQEFRVSAVVPDGVWSAWLVLSAEATSTIYFDLVSLKSVSSLTMPPQWPSEEIRLYPNPSNQFVNIHPDLDVDLVEVYRLNGEVIHPTVEENKIDVRDWQSGIYMIRIREENFVAKIVVF
ncbi:MAG: GDSL-type esterase/lipase family protein [Bacteroidota bacterium]